MYGTEQSTKKKERGIASSRWKPSLPSHDNTVLFPILYSLLSIHTFLFLSQQLLVLSTIATIKIHLAIVCTVVLLSLMRYKFTRRGPVDHFSHLKMQGISEPSHCTIQ
jgi:hypothetical protein